MVKIPRSIKAGLDTEHFDIIRVMSLGHFYPVIVMRDKRSDSRDLWCLQYRGSGYYSKPKGHDQLLHRAKMTKPT